MRNKVFDILKVLGLLCIILAHVNPPKVIFQLRNFDVVLMIIVSSLLFCEKSYKIDTFKEWIKYFFKRFKRLVIPTWIFLVVFFILMFIFKGERIPLKLILSTFALYNGIGYVWIIRIYLIVALILPLMFKYLSNELKKYKKIFLLNIFIFVIYEIMCLLGVFRLILLDYIFAYVVPCYTIINITYWLKNNTNKNIIIFSIINLVIFFISGVIIYIITGEIKDTNYMKYPFRIYYLSYAFFASALLIVFLRKEKIVNLLYNKVVIFISKSSLWIYLWHILILYIVNNLFIDLNWIFQYFAVVISAVGITFFQNKIIDFLDKKEKYKKYLIVFRG